MATYPTNPPGTTLAAIQTKVRRLTRSISENQLTTDDLNNYINTFVVYDFPEHLRMFNLRTTFTFTCNPFQDQYPTDIVSFGGATLAEANPLYDFQNNFISIHEPVYIAGYQSFFSQSREQFFGIYPNVNNISSIGTAGDGVTTTFTGYINASQAIVPTNLTQTITLLQNNVLFSSVDVDGNGLALEDQPILDAVTGNPTVWGQLILPQNYYTTPPTPLLLTAPYFTNPDFPTTNWINYVTGQFNIEFPNAPASGQLINSQSVPSVVTLPQALLYYDDVITLRPAPDQPYRVQFEAYMRPTRLMETNSNPMLNEWWQYIAYGAAKKIFEDRMDMESVQMIMPEFLKQERLCLRRTIVQYTNERVATIYTEQTSFGPGSGAWGWGGGPF